MDRTFLTNALVFDPETGQQPQQTVVVDGGRITYVGASATSPSADADDVVLDLAGRTLMPGLVLAHCHAQLGLSGYENYGDKYPGSERPPGVLMAVAIRTCRTLLESGVTGFVGAACSHDIDVSLQMAIREGIIDGPRIMPCGRQLNTTAHDNDLWGAKWWYEMGNLGMEVFADGADEMVKAVRNEVRRGVQIVKIYPTGGHGVFSKSVRGLSPAELHAVVETAHDLGVKVRAHCAWRDAIIESVTAGVDVIDHGDEVDEQCIDLMAERGTFWVPSMNFLRKTPDMPGSRDAWDNLCKMLPLAVDAGVRVVAPGDDYGVPGLLPHEVGTYGEELSIYVDEVGLRPVDVLRWATLNGAALLGLTDDGGRVAEGAVADLIVVDGDPAADISVLGNPAEKLHVVIADGRLVKNRLPVASAV